MAGKVLMNLEETLLTLRKKLEIESSLLTDRLQELAQKERQLESRLEAVTAEITRIENEQPRLNRLYFKQQVLALKETLGRVASTLEDPNQGAWGDSLPILTTLVKEDRSGAAIQFILPVAPDIVENWDSHRETPPLRIAMVAYATLVKIALEHDIVPMPEMGSWDRFLTMKLDLSTMSVNGLGELESMDAALFLEEATPTPWAGGGREMVPGLIWVPPELIRESEC